MDSALRENNPFITGYLVNYEEGDQSLERFKINYKPSDNDELHTIRDFDTLGSIAYDKYGSSKWWWVIADVNDIFNPFELQVNTNLIIPDLDYLKATVF